jgi:uncharacterized protein GlcG (DUF336 family)
MNTLTLEAAQKIISEALAFAHSKKFMPLGIIIVDARGALKASAIEDKSSLMRWKVAFAKASGAINMGMGSRKLMGLAADRPAFIAGATPLAEMGLMPVPGGVLIRNKDGDILGAVGVSGDTSDNDELAGIAGIEAAGLVADAG